MVLAIKKHPCVGVRGLVTVSVDVVEAERRERVGVVDFAVHPNLFPDSHETAPYGTNKKRSMVSRAAKLHDLLSYFRTISMSMIVTSSSGSDDV